MSKPLDLDNILNRLMDVGEEQSKQIAMLAALIDVYAKAVKELQERLDAADERVRMMEVLMHGDRDSDSTH